ncbi:MAG: right-handed parallel beta-helix repeat-containing protein, partial [Bacteroidaceae bacterium]|nr:right-handed parallel beta-helix repeat-containing protein [Bacteroidaceae bacterium]
MKRLTHRTLSLGIALMMLFPILICSCSDEEEFTSDRNALLTFSTDTVSFDTLFMEVTSATERFCIYNPNSKGLRINHVRFASGGTSGFMMNVDGQSGSVIQDVQVYGKDSAFVFVKVNIPMQSSVKPTQVTDAIIFTLESGAEQKVQLVAYGQRANVW